MKNNIEFGSGKLHKIKPDSLINKDELINEIDSFFLTLALVHNDLKGLFYFDRFIEDNKPTDLKKVSGSVGEYAGLKLQVFKLVSSCVHEIMLLIEKNDSIISSDRFLGYVNRLSRQDLDIWRLLLNVTHRTDLEKQDEKNEKFRNLLIKIRSNVTFHYYQTAKPLAIGYRDHFLKHRQGQADSYNFAFYSLQKTSFDNNRFYYADAALEGYLKNCIGTFDDINHFSIIIYNLSAEISKVIVGLLDQYLKEKPMV